PGGRSARVQESVHSAVRELLEAHERSSVTVPMIAARAGVTPSTIYRRWGDLSALLADVAALAVQLYLSGGASNPFIYLFLLQAILSAVLLSPAYTWVIAAITSLCVIDLAGSSRPLAVQPDNNLYVIGLLTCFVLTTVLLVIFLTRIVGNLRRRDSRLADMRQRASEEEHIVRMGLLATGAAHELGTPLATMSVILGDWQRIPEIARQPELLQDLDEMRQQLLRCKSIVTNVLLSAGEARADAPKPTTLFRFMDRLIAQWQETHHPGRFRYHNGIAQDLAIISDTALQQMICNVLDNALEASADEVELRLRREDDQLVITVLDRGTGFAPEILRNFGKYQQSNKTDRAGRGVGLFLVTNVARSLDGTASARNRDDGGAEVRIQFPLSSITLGDTDHGTTPAAAG
ncbi:MAG: ATP-binding protein, partial [Comamonas sp.]